LQRHQICFEGIVLVPVCAIKRDDNQRTARSRRRPRPSPLCLINRHGYYRRDRELADADFQTKPSMSQARK
jgi:hypothetical protein